MGDFSDRNATVDDDGISVISRREEDIGPEVLNMVDNDEDNERRVERIHQQSTDNFPVPDPSSQKRLCLAMCCGRSTAGTGGTSLAKGRAVDVFKSAITRFNSPYFVCKSAPNLN